MTLYTVEFSNEAWNAIEAQVRFIAEQNLALLNASRWVKRSLAEITTLENLPGRSPVDQQQSQIHGSQGASPPFRAHLFYFLHD